MYSKKIQRTPMGASEKYKTSSRIDQSSKNKTLKQMYKALSAEYHPYLTLSRISVRPHKKLCDLTGLPGIYTCPRTLLRYYNISAYKYLQELTSERSEKFFEIRNYASKLFNIRK